jgi:hypothetical protein
MPSVKELEELLGSVKKGGSVKDFSGGRKKPKSGLTRGKKDSSSKMEGAYAQAHAFDGILDYARRKSIYGGQEGFQGGQSDYAGMGGAVQPGLQGGVVQMVPALAGALASAVIPAIGSSLAKLLGSGEYDIEGALRGGQVGPVSALLASAAVPELVTGLVGAVNDLSGGGQAGFQGGYGFLVPILVEALVGSGRQLGGLSPAYYGPGQVVAGKKGKGKAPIVSTGSGVSDFAGGKKKSSARSAAAKKQAKSNPWMKHVAQVRKENPGMSYKDVLVLAKDSY